VPQLFVTARKGGCKGKIRRNVTGNSSNGTMPLFYGKHWGISQVLSERIYSFRSRIEPRVFRKKAEAPTTTPQCAVAILKRLNKRHCNNVY